MTYVSEDYIKAYKMGKKDYQARMMRGEVPTLKVLDDILPSRGSYSEVPDGKCMPDGQNLHRLTCGTGFLLSGSRC